MHYLNVTLQGIGRRIKYKQDLINFRQID